MILNLHEERISNNEIALAKIDIVTETVAREVADLQRQQEPLSVRKRISNLILKIERSVEERLRKNKEQLLSP